MPSFFFALVATFLAATGGRDQRLAAALAERLGASPSLLVTYWLVAIAMAAIAAFAGAGLAVLLPPAAKTMLIAFALFLAAVELAWPIKSREPDEPTRSLAAIAIVLASRQVGDGARFLIVGIAAGTGAPYLAALGGALGGGAALTLGWALGSELTRRRYLRWIRLAIAALLLVAALWSGLSARGIV